MRSTAVGMTALAAVLHAAGLSAQPRPNFAGHWTAEPTAGGRPFFEEGSGGSSGASFVGGFACGDDCIIRQDGTSLSVERQLGRNAVTLTVKLDGSESKNSGESSKASWSGAKLVIKTTRLLGGHNVETRTTLWLDGGKLTIASTRGNGTEEQTASRVYTRGASGAESRYGVPTGDRRRPPLADTLRAGVGLRNRIAHGYAQLDYRRVQEEALTGIPALEAFLAAVAREAGL